MQFHMTMPSLMCAAVVLVAIVSTPLRSSTTTATASVQPHAPVTAIVLDVPEGRLRAQAFADATQVIGVLEQGHHRIAVMDITDGLVVAADVTTPIGAREAMQHLQRRSTWTYRHRDIPAPSAVTPRPTNPGQSLRSVAADVATAGASGRIVLVTDIRRTGRKARAYADATTAARALGVRVHVIGYQEQDASDGNTLLGSTITSTAQAMQDCDPRRVACGLAEQVGQESRTERAAQVAATERELSRLARETGGTWAPTSGERAALLRRLSAAEPGASAGSPTPTAPAWRDRDARAADALEGARLEDTGDLPELDIIRIPSSNGLTLVLVLHHSASASVDLSASPWYAFVRVRDGLAKPSAIFSETRSAADGPFIRAVTVASGRPVVDALVEDARGTRMARHVLDAGPMAATVAGDLFLVGSVETATNGHAGHPLASDGRLYLPSSSHVIRRSTTTTLNAAIAVRTRGASARVTVDLLSAGQRTRRTTLEMAGSGEDVRLQLMTVPVATLRDGTHELRVSGEHQGRPWVRSRRVAVVP